MEKYLETLNPAQREAVLSEKGPILVVAGAGAGKTKTLTHRIIHLLKNEADPESILAITFTNKAAKEMQERLNILLAEEPSLNLPVSNFFSTPTGTVRPGQPWIGTFHSLGVKILRENFREAGVPASFSIFDREDSQKTVREAMKRRGVDPKSFEPSKILGLISREKGDFVSASTFSENQTKSHFGKLVSSIWLEYERILSEEKGLDFDDLILRPAILLSKNDNIREKYQKIWKYIHIDEYQDTNTAQYHMAKNLVGKEKNIFVVGDGDQLIYGWRGADIKNILGFEKDYPEAKVFLLEENYRSTKTILSVANRIIAKNRLRKEKNLFTKNTEGERIGIYSAMDETDEANFVSEKAGELIKSGVKPSELAVLYRANFQSRALEEAFIQKKLPHQVIGTRFFERREIKDVVSYLKASLNPDNPADWRRISSAPPRGIGKVALAKIALGQKDSLSPTAKKAVENIEKLLSETEEKIKKEKMSSVVRFLITSSGLLDWLKKEGQEERIENLNELVSFSSRYDGEIGKSSAEKMLTDIALSTDQDEMEDKGEKIRLMTVHASKGLEFDVVFITGLEENLFPHKKLSAENVSDSEEEEERRLFYVALTRAKKKIYLSYAGIRTIFGARQVNVPSEFILDIDEEFVSNEEPLVGGGKIIYLD